MKQFEKIIKRAFIFVGLAVSAISHAGETEIRERLAEFLPGVEITEIRQSAMPHLYEVVLGPKLVYISEDAKYLIQGQLIDILNKKDLTEEKQAEVRVSALESMGTGQMIEFSPKDPKYHVSVFTDVDCGYCRKLHAEIDNYMKAGIAVRYLFFPRAGLNSKSYDTAVSVWCSDDRNAALTRAKNGKDLPKKVCDNPVKAHMELGDELGVRGTPMIVTEAGGVLPGYVAANRLLEYLQYEDKQHTAGLDQASVE